MAAFGNSGLSRGQAGLAVNMTAGSGPAVHGRCRPSLLVGLGLSEPAVSVFEDRLAGAIEHGGEQEPEAAAAAEPDAAFQIALDHKVRP